MSFSFQTDGFLKDNNNAAQRLLDGMNFMAQSVSELSLGPTKAVTSWLTDQIAPAYWRPNSQILVNSNSCREKLCIAKTLFPHPSGCIVFCFLFYCSQPFSYNFEKTEMLSALPVLELARESMFSPAKDTVSAFCELLSQHITDLHELALQSKESTS